MFLQVTPSFKNLVARNPDLCLNFIKEVSLCLSIPCLPEPADPDGNPLKEDADSECPETPVNASNSPSTSQIPSLGEPYKLSIDYPRHEMSIRAKQDYVRLSN